MNQPDTTPDERIFNQFSFTAQGLTEEELDEAIKSKLDRHLTDPSDWTIVQKQMSLTEVPVGENQIEMITAEIAVIRLVGVAVFNE
jgi:hypothetical protein